MKVTFSSSRWLSIKENSHRARFGAGSISSAIMCTLGPVKTENNHGCHRERHLVMKNSMLKWATKQKQEKENNNVINVKSWFRPLNLFRRRGCLSVLEEEVVVVMMEVIPWSMELRVVVEMKVVDARVVRRRWKRQMQRCVEAVFCGENNGNINNKLQYKIKLKLSFQKQQTSQLKCWCCCDDGSALIWRWRWQWRWRRKWKRRDLIGGL